MLLTPKQFLTAAVLAGANTQVNLPAAPATTVWIIKSIRYMTSGTFIVKVGPTGTAATNPVVVANKPADNDASGEALAQRYGTAINAASHEAFTVVKAGDSIYVEAAVGTLNIIISGFEFTP